MSEKRTYRKFSAKQKAEIVLAGLRGDRSVRDVCREAGIAETLSYSWRDRLLEGGQRQLAGRDEPVLVGDDRALRARLREFAVRRPRWGYRRAQAELDGERWGVNRKRVGRRWRKESLRVPARRHKRRRRGESTVQAERR